MYLSDGLPLPLANCRASSFSSTADATTLGDAEVVCIATSAGGRRFPISQVCLHRAHHGLGRSASYPTSLSRRVRKLSSTAEDSEDSRSRTSKAIEITTALDSQRASRRVERRITEHTDLYQQAQIQDGTARVEQVTSGEPSQDSSKASDETAFAEVRAVEEDRVVPGLFGAGALRLQDPNAPSVQKEQGSKDLVVRSRTTTGQVLWPATREDIEILSESKLMYPAPYEVEGSVIIRLVRLSDPVTSPVGRVVRNRQFGIRGNEKWQLLAMGAVCCVFIYSLGFWQLRRMEWKRDLIEMRRTRLAMPRLVVNSSPFPWRDQKDDYLYRVVEVRGVFDHHREMLVGPRPGANDAGETMSGYLVVTPLCLEDGSRVLVNRGHVCADKVDRAKRPEVPTWVKVRGVLEEGEVPNLVGQYARLKNRPDRNLFVYLVADELAENAGARNHRECAQALITAFDVLHEDDFKAGVRREGNFSMRHKEDYLLFWADEHTHFNYAMQWFGMGSLIMVMTIYKFIEVSRWKF